jgi:hypothetical protein
MWSAQTLGAAADPLGYWATKIAFTGSTSAGDIATDSVGNVYACGGITTTGTVGAMDAFLVKYNSLGAIQWNRFLGGTSTDSFEAIAIDSSNNIYVAGRTTSSSIGASLLAKYNASGTQQWVRTLGTNTTFHNNSWLAVDTDSSGNIYVAGETYNTTNRGIIAKYDSSGAVIWQKSLDGGPSHFNSLATAADGTSYVAGINASGLEGSQDISIFKYDSSGNVVWQKNLGTASGNENPADIKIDSSGNICVAGRTSVGGTTSHLLVKLNPEGSILWQTQLAGTSVAAPNAISIDASNNIYLAGFMLSGSNYNVHIVKYNLSGQVLWQRVFGGVNFELGEGIVAGTDGSFYFLMDGSIPYNFLVCKMGSNGELIGTFNIGDLKATYGPTSFTSSSSSLVISSTTYGSSSDSETAATPTLTENERTLSIATKLF